MNRRKQMIAGNEISELEEWNLGGYPQKVLLEGKKKNLPIVITLHGGPGTPIPFSVGCRGLFPELTDRFIMVYWDQLGCGINNRPMKDIFSVELFVEMTCDLVKKVRERFPENRILFQSVSWGTVLSALAADSVCEEISGVVAWGQVVRNLLFNEVTMQTLKKSGMPEEKLQKILSMESGKVSGKDMGFAMSCLKKYTKGQTNPMDSAPVGPIIRGLLTSPDYGFRDFKAVVQNGYTGLDSPAEALMALDLQKTLETIKAPYRILVGETDLITPPAIAEETVREANNPMLTCEIVPDSSHFFGKKGMEAIVDTLTELAED